MATTNFTTGTLIESSWLNDVDEHIYDQDTALHASSNITYTPTGTGAVATTVQAKLRESVSVKDFGAVGDGVTDDTVAIQAALISGAKKVIAPAANYLFTELTIPTGVSLIGDNLTSTVFKTATNSDALTIGGANINLVNFTLLQTGAIVGKGIVGIDKYWLTTENILVSGFEYNLYCSKAIYHSHKQSRFEGGNYGAYYYGSAGTWNIDWYNNIIVFDNCRFNNNTLIGCYAKGAEITFINPDLSGMESSGSVGLQVVGESTSHIAHGIKVINPYFEVTDIPFSFQYAFIEIDGGFVQGGPASGASAFTSIIDADSSTVFWNGRPSDQDYFDNGYRLTNNTKLIFEYGFTGSVRTSNSADSTSKYVLADYDNGTYIAAITGLTTSPTVTATYSRSGNNVTIQIPENTGTSNTTACTITGMPASLIPTKEQICFAAVFDTGAEYNGIARILTNGTIALYRGAFGALFTNSGIKGNRVLSLSYCKA